MEKRTMGGFIAALRKANGMTQRELAERLNVSDKSVSRWERDDGAPDLSLIPAIAEIFDVTCDELLRGARRPPAERLGGSEDGETSPKGEKQRQRLLKSALSRYQDMTYIAMGVSVVGLIAALICNLAFLKAVLGFLVGTIFFAAGVVCQAVFMNRAFSRVEDGETEPAALSGYRRKVIRLAERSVGVTVFCLGFTSPLALVDAYLGLGADSLWIWGAMGAAAFMALYAIALYFLNWVLLKKGVYTLPDRELAAYEHDHRLKGRCGGGLAAALAVTLLVHLVGAEVLWSTDALSAFRGTVFHDYESFVACMEQDIPYVSIAPDQAVAPLPEEEGGETIYYDEEGNPITEEEALTRTLADADGQVVCTYLARNQSVVSIRYTAGEGTVLPIRVLTQEDYWAARQLSGTIFTVYCLLYPLEGLIAVLIYRKRRSA